MTEAPAGIQRILVVDDSEIVLELVQSNLVAAGYAVTLASSGEQALKLYEQNPPDLVLLDILMSPMDGFEVCSRLRATQSGAVTPIVFLTALSDLATHQRALESGADDLLTKPINRTELLMRVRSLLWLRRLREDLRQGYELIRSQRDALLRTQRQKEELTTLLIHDLRNPLSSIQISAQYLLTSLDAAAAGRQFAEEILTASQAMNRMLMNMLDISRSEDGALSLRYADVDLLKLLEEVKGTMARRAKATGQRILASVSPQAGRVSADEDLLRRLLENLLDNCLRHSPEGATIKMDVDPAENGEILLRVSDEGPGVPEPFRQKIFEKYVRLEPKTGAKDRAGRGLGLAFCRLAAEAHRGRIWVEDNTPKGSAFCVRLPKGRG